MLDYAYDERGNLASITAASDITAYDFDARDRLSQVTKPDTSAILYAYDHDGRRISETVGTDEVHHVWDEESTYGDIVLDYDENDVALASYVLAGDRLISQERGSTTHYYLMDGQRNVRALSSSSANTTDTYDYDAYGTLNDTSGTTENPYRYTGQRFDTFSELYNLRARDYDASVGRFLSRDTWPVDTFNPVELNRYGYTANNPINGFDPTGYTETLLEYAQITGGVSLLILAASYIYSNEYVLEAIDNWLSEAQKTYENTKDQTKKTFGDFKDNLPKYSEKFCETVDICKVLGGSSSPLGFWGKVAFSVLITTLTITLTGDTPSPDPEPDPQQQPPDGGDKKTKEEECKKKPWYLGCNEDDFDIAFGRGEYLLQFAASFTRPTKPFIHWPDWLIKDSKGNFIPTANRNAFKDNFHYMMGLYFAKIPHGRFKFNLHGMDNSAPNSLTTWELRTIYHNPFYNSRTDYYDMIGGVKTQLTGVTLAAKVQSIGV